MDKQLEAMIEEFLSERRISEGGWAKPTMNDMSQLADIIFELITLKFETDPDGDLPVFYILADKSENELPRYVPTKHIGKIKNRKEWIQTIFDLKLNRDMAEDRFMAALEIFLRLEK